MVLVCFAWEVNKVLQAPRPKMTGELGMCENKAKYYRGNKQKTKRNSVPGTSSDGRQATAQVPNLSRNVVTYDAQVMKNEAMIPA